jgi:metal-responsive CopG/Arc/MetJ family transcriptional regulator
METKKKLSVTIDKEVLEAVENASKTYHMAKSQLAQEALKLWLKRRTQELLARGYTEMAEEDKEFAELSFEAQKEILS